MIDVHTATAGALPRPAVQCIQVTPPFRLIALCSLLTTAGSRIRRSNASKSLPLRHKSTFPRKEIALHNTIMQVSLLGSPEYCHPYKYCSKLYDPEGVDHGVFFTCSITTEREVPTGEEYYSKDLSVLKLQLASGILLSQNFLSSYRGFISKK